MRPSANQFDRAFLYSVLLFILVVSVELAAGCILNGGHFTYTLDDPYIHLTLAERIMDGHYGINAGENSSPSSSAVWPFLLVPFSFAGVFSPLILNIIISIVVFYVLGKILGISLKGAKPGSGVRTFLMLLFAYCTNMVGLVFTGMEHSLQLLASVLAAYGMMTMTVNKRPANWFIAVTVFAPLVRYELLAISAVSLILFLIYGYYRTAILALAGTILSLGAYSYFLVTLGLDPLPSSVLLKSSVAYEGTVWAVFRNLRDNLSLHENFPLLAALCVFTVSSLYSKDSARRILSRLAVLAVILHFLAGKFGWYYRYEAYIVGFCIATAFFVFSGTLGKELAGRRSRALASIAGCAFIIFYHYTYSLFTIPLASNNIYEQQYQMHRFATVFYRKPVAVNDIGYVSYKNPYYVLDLAGLSSGEKVRNFRILENTDWMTDMARSKDVHFAMIYQHRFDKIPDDWIKIGDLHLGKIRITPADSIVAFYALDTVAYNSTLPLIAEFRQVLPQGVRFTYYGIR